MHKPKIKGGLLILFGNINLGTCFNIGDHRDLWRTKSLLELRFPQKFGDKTGI